MSARRRLWTLALLAAAVGATLVLLQRCERPADIGSAGARDPHQEPGAGPLLVGGTAPRPTRPVRQPGSATDDAPPEASAGVTLRGVVRDTAGEPVAQAYVYATPKDRSTSRGLDDPATHTDARGEWTLRLPAAAGWWIAAGHATMFPAYVDADLHAPADLIEMVLEPAPEMRVFVVDGTGAPVPSVQVSIVPAPGRPIGPRPAPGEPAFSIHYGGTDERGQTTFRIRDRGPVVVRAGHPGMVSEPVTLERPEGRVEVRLQPAGRVVVHMLDARTRATVQGPLGMGVRHPETARQPSGRGVRLMPGGLELSGLDVGTWRVTASCEGYLPWEQVVRIATFGATVEVEALLEPDPSVGALEVHVAEPPGTHVTAVVRARGEARPSWRIVGAWQAPDRPGTLRFCALPPGEVDLFLITQPTEPEPGGARRAPGRSAYLAGLRVRARELTTERTRLIPGTQVRLRSLLEPDTKIRSLRVLSPGGDDPPLAGRRDRSLEFWLHGALPASDDELGPYPWDSVSVRIETTDGRLVTSTVTAR